MNEKSIPLVYAFILDMDKRVSARTVISARCGDTVSQTLNITLTSGGDKILLPQNSSVTVYSRLCDGSSVWSACSVLDDGTVSHTLTSSETAVPGDMECELYIVTPTSEITSPKFRIHIDGIIRDNSAVEASDDFSALGELLNAAQNLNISMTGKTLCLTDRNGDISTISFSDKTDGKVTVTFTDVNSDTSSFVISDGSNSVSQGTPSSLLVCSDFSGELKSAGQYIFLLDESDSDILDKTCAKIYAENGEYLVFVKSNGKYLPAQCQKNRQKLYVNYDYYDSNGAYRCKTVIWNPNGGNQKISFENSLKYADEENWYDDTYYFNCAPLVSAVDAKLSEKYTKPSGGIPASDMAAGVIPSVPSNVSAFSNDAGYLTLSTLPLYDGSVT